MQPQLTVAGLLQSRSEAIGLPLELLSGQEGTARPITFMADVVAVDKDNLVVRLRGPGGQVTEYPVHDRAALAGIREGDQVHVAMNQAVAVGVTPAKR